MVESYNETHPVQYEITDTWYSDCGDMERSVDANGYLSRNRDLDGLAHTTCRHTPFILTEG